MNLNQLRDEALDNAEKHGFKDATIGEDLALMHSELSEALEDHRAGAGVTEVWYEERIAVTSSVTVRLNHEDVDETTVTTAVTRHKKMVMLGQGGVMSVYKPCGIPSELADCLIRILHFSGKHGIDLEDAVSKKMEYNRNRPFKHGKIL